MSDFGSPSQTVIELSKVVAVIEWSGIWGVFLCLWNKQKVSWVNSVTQWYWTLSYLLSACQNCTCVSQCAFFISSFFSECRCEELYQCVVALPSTALYSKLQLKVQEEKNSAVHSRCCTPPPPSPPPPTHTHTHALCIRSIIMWKWLQCQLKRM